MQNPPILTERRSRGQVIDFFTKKSKTCPSDLNENDQKNRPHDPVCNSSLISVYNRRGRRIPDPDHHCLRAG